MPTSKKNQVCECEASLESEVTEKSGTFICQWCTPCSSKRCHWFDYEILQAGSENNNIICTSKKVKKDNKKKARENWRSDWRWRYRWVCVLHMAKFNQPVLDFFQREEQIKLYFCNRLSIQEYLDRLGIFDTGEVGPRCKTCRIKCHQTMELNLWVLLLVPWT